MEEVYKKVSAFGTKINESTFVIGYDEKRRKKTFVVQQWLYREKIYSFILKNFQVIDYECYNI